MNRDTSNLTKYIESANIDYRLIKKVDTAELKESISKFNERRMKESIEATAGWWVPISFYEKKNANGRIYGKQLWENVINNQRDIWYGSPMLMDHPSGDSDGSPANICGVWIDAKMDPPDRLGEGLVYGLLVPSGHWGEDLKEHLKNGLKVGTSSSGFGKLLGDGVTVDPSSYLIERLSDWVLNPSQGTFFSYDESLEDVVDTSKNTFTESIEHKEFKEKFVKDSKIAKLEEKKFRRDMESFLEDASNIKDPQERLLEFKEIESYLEDGACPDLKEKIEEKIAAEEEYIRTALKEKAELKEELQIESPKDLKKKLTKIVEDAAILDKEAKDWKKISESLQEELLTTKAELEDRPTQAYTSYLREKNDILSKTYESKRTQAKKVVVDTAMAYTEATKINTNLNKTNKILEKENENLKEELTKTKSLLENSILIIKNLRENFEKNSSIAERNKERLAKSTKKNISYKKDQDILEKENNDLKNKLEESKNKIEELNYQINKLNLSKINKRKKDNLKEKLDSLSEPQKYFLTLRETYGNEIDKYENKIAGARTLAEAKRIFFKDVLQNLEESKQVESMRIPESLNVSPEDRQKALGKSNFKKADYIERKPEGWY